MANTAPNFQSVLDTPSDEIDRTVKQLPVGSYLAVVSGQPEYGKSSQKQTEQVDFSMKILEARDDVDEDALEEYLTKADGTVKKLSDCTIKNRFYITENSMFRLMNFLDHLDGVKPGQKGPKDSPRQRISEATGKQCILSVRHKPWNSGEGVTAEVGQTSVAE